MLLLSEHEKVIIKARIGKIINDSDLDKITVKGIRRQIEEEDSKDYSEDKTFFAEAVKLCLEERLQKEQSENLSSKETNVNEEDDFKMAMQLQHEEEEKSTQRIHLRRRAAGTNRKYQEGLVIVPSKNKQSLESVSSDTSKRRVLNKPLLLSPEMAAVFDDQFTELSRPEVVKKLWDYIKANNLQDPKDKRFILCDQKLINVFNKNRINCFKMAKYLSAHLHKIEDLSDATLKKSKLESKSVAKQPKSISSPKKAKMSSDIVGDSDEEAEEYLHNDSGSDSDESEMNPLLLKVPGVTADMTYNAVQAAILAYTQVKKLRDPKDPDMVIIRPGTPIAAIMGNTGKGNVHLLDLIQRVHFLFDNKTEK